MKPLDPTHSKALEEKIKKLVDGLVEKVQSKGGVVSEGTQANIAALLMRLDVEQEAEAYERAMNQLMGHSEAPVTKIKTQLNILLVLALQALPEKVAPNPILPVKTVSPPTAPVEKQKSRVAQFFLSLLSTPKAAPGVEANPDEPVESFDIYTLPKDYGWIDLLVEAVVDSITRDYNQTTDLGFSRLLTLRNELEEGTRHIEPQSELFSQVSTWINGLNQVILHAQPHSFLDHCQQFEYRQYMLKKHGLLAEAGNPLSDSMKNALVYYADQSSLLEDIMDINECRLLGVPDKAIFIDNSVILADCYRILRDMIDKERKADALALVSKVPLINYHRQPGLQLIINRINQITRTFIEHVDKAGHDVYARDYVQNAIKGCYLAKIKIYNFEAKKSKHDAELIHRNICALADLTEYIMRSLEQGDANTWAGQFFDWLCAFVNGGSSATRDVKLFSAGYMFNSVANGSRYKHTYNMCPTLDKQYGKTMNKGELGDIKKHYQIKI